MLNIGQVVYDYTNERVVIFAGLEILQNKKTGRCRSEAGFILKNGTFVQLKDKDAPFEYTNLNMEGRIFLGSFVDKSKLRGHYLGVVNGDIPKVKTWAKEAIEEVEKLITKHGLNMIKKGTFPYYCIGQVKNN